LLPIADHDTFGDAVAIDCLCPWEIGTVHSRLLTPLCLTLGAFALLFGTLLYRYSLGPLFYVDDWATLTDAIDSSDDIGSERIESLMERVGDAKVLDDLGVCYVLGESVWVDGKNVSDAGVLYTFEIPNEGRDAVEIVDIKTSCGCAKAEISATTIAAGEQASLKLSISHEKLSDGPHNYWVVLKTDQGEFWRYGVKVDIVRAASWDRGDIYFGDVSETSQKEISAEVRLFQPSFVNDLEFQGIELTSDLVKATTGPIESTQNGKGVVEHRVPVRLSLASQVAPREGQGLCYAIAEYVSGGQKHEAVTRVHWEKSLAYHVTPARLVLRSSNALADPIRITVSHTSKTPFTIRSAKLPEFLALVSDEDSLRVPAEEQVVSLAVLHDHLPSKHEFSDIVLKTDVADNATVTVPLAFLHVVK
jgi:uncharacterized protein DUF1573